VRDARRLRRTPMRAAELQAVLAISPAVLPLARRRPPAAGAERGLAGQVREEYTAALERAALPLEEAALEAAHAAALAAALAGFAARRFGGGGGGAMRALQDALVAGCERELAARRTANTLRSGQARAALRAPAQCCTCRPNLKYTLLTLTLLYTAAVSRPRPPCQARPARAAVGQAWAREQRARPGRCARRRRSRARTCWSTSRPARCPPWGASTRGTRGATRASRRRASARRAPCRRAARWAHPLPLRDLDTPESGAGVLRVDRLPAWNISAHAQRACFAHTSERSLRGRGGFPSTAALAAGAPQRRFSPP